MAALAHAYFDESGTHDGSPFVVVAGYIFEDDNAQLLDAEWQKMLGKRGLPFLHMKDCVHAANDYKRLGMSGCDELAREAIELTKTYAAKGIAISIEKDALELIPKKLNQLWNTPYSFLVGQVFHGVAKWADEVKFCGGVSYFFEAGAQGWGNACAAIDVMKAHPVANAAFRLHSYARIDKRHASALQCADMLAWHWFTHRKRLARGESKARADFKNLIGLRTDPHHYDKKSIALWLDVLGFVERLEKNTRLHSSLEVLTRLIPPLPPES